ncbi:hypothetical protein ACI1US_02070 [Leucobacter sp. BZR 635]|uniref:hypothetical protein n=1 Tax=Leucobacter sp. BZR 635 TaxID=3378705 RepID=UPI003A89D19F
MPPIPLPARLLITWLAIFPLVSIAQAVFQPLLASWPTLLVTAITVAAVVPVAVIWVVPGLTKLYFALAHRRARTGNEG